MQSSPICSTHRFNVWKTTKKIVKTTLWKYAVFALGLEIYIWLPTLVCTYLGTQHSWELRLEPGSQKNPWKRATDLYFKVRADIANSIRLFRNDVMSQGQPSLEGISKPLVCAHESRQQPVLVNTKLDTHWVLEQKKHPNTKWPLINYTS